MPQQAQQQYNSRSPSDWKQSEGLCFFCPKNNLIILKIPINKMRILCYTDVIKGTEGVMTSKELEKKIKIWEVILC